MTLKAEEEPGDYPSLQELQEKGEGQFLEPLRITVTAEREYDHIRVHGNVATRMELPCSRCLTGFETEIASAFTIIYTPATTIAQDEEVELAEEDLISTTYEGHEIDLCPEIAAQVLLEIPFKPLCSDECRGLCSNCGADLNKTECGCTNQAASLKFSALKNFKIER